MSTRSNIVFKRTDEEGFKTLKAVYCHYDGYPGFTRNSEFVGGVGYELLNHHNTQSKIDEIELKSIRSIESKIEYMGEKEEYDSYEDIKQYFRMTQGDIFIEYIYYWDGVQWMMSELTYLDTDMNKYQDTAVSIRTKLKPLQIVIDEITGTISPSDEE
tara:strand:- start:48 stop:521 length:474 start_codon:yes stop_codon:yes gene_type:complete